MQTQPIPEAPSLGRILDELSRVRSPDPTAGLPENTAAPPENIVLLRTVPSTNQLARHIAVEYLKESESVPSALVMALEQTAGRGRHGRAWSSPDGLGLYATLILPLSSLEELPRLPLLAGVGLARTLDQYLDGECRLKWPNDLMIEGKKVGGILIETETRHAAPPIALVGFGINYGQTAQQLPTATSTSMALSCSSSGSRLGKGDCLPELPTLAAELVGSLLSELQWRGDNRETLRRYTQYSLHRPGDQVRCRLEGEEPLEGTFLGFDDRGFLRMRQGEREILLNTGDLEALKRDDGES